MSWCLTPSTWNYFFLGPEYILDFVVIALICVRMGPREREVVSVNL